jgi:hypothetical protein
LLPCSSPSITSAATCASCTALCARWYVNGYQQLIKP